MAVQRGARGGGFALTPVKVGPCASRLEEEKPTVRTERWAMGTYVMFTRLSHDALRAANAPEELCRAVMERVHKECPT
jgi:hypothetical protein